MPDGMAQRFAEEFAALAAIGREADGYHRAGWSPAELAARDWFAGRAKSLGLAVEADGNGNVFAWWGHPAAGGALLLGSHLDTVPAGGAYDGALGVVAGLVAVAEVAGRGLPPTRPVGVAAFTEEEGSRFGVACLGSRLAAGVLATGDAVDRTDAAGATLAEVVRASGGEPQQLGDSRQLDRVAAAVELHIEQGRALADLAAPVAVGTQVLPHGRWAFRFTGQADHAGTTRIGDRHDPMLALAALVNSARAEAESRGAVATVGRVTVSPNAANAIPRRVECWLDARAPAEPVLDEVVTAVTAAAGAAASAQGVQMVVHRESFTPAVEFDEQLQADLVALLEGMGLPAPLLATAAGHDAAVLASVVPSAMLYVRNRTGVSHSPDEHADDEDCVTGCEVLVRLVEKWVGG